MEKARFYKKLKGNIVQCQLCPHLCAIKENESGRCRVRMNSKGVLYSLVYGRPCAVHIDPIEKKPLYHFLPGSSSYSIGTPGCNLACLFCQNWTISQAAPTEVPFIELPPEKAVKEAIASGCKSISYTYTEPLIAMEYVIDTAKLARKNGLKNVIVSNGYVNEQPLGELCRYLDAANIDLKAFTEDFYKVYTASSLKPVLRTLKILKKEGVWLEITNLIIPGLNDDITMIEKMCVWIKNNLGDIPLHISRFHPEHRMLDIKPTPLETLEKAYRVASKYLSYVYIGNVLHKTNSTFCPQCGKLAIERKGYNTVSHIKDSKCGCSKSLLGVF